MALARVFRLEWDVTKQRTGPLTSAAAAGLSSRALPFVVFSTDILIEGCGWVELVAQVRKRKSGMYEREFCLSHGRCLESEWRLYS